jgi:Mg/Co/Ni transporter MgtE
MVEPVTDESSILLERSALIAEALMQKDWPKLRDALRDLHPSDIADMVIALPPKHEGILFRVLPRQVTTRVFAYLPTEYQEELWHRSPAARSRRSSTISRTTIARACSKRCRRTSLGDC